jgi:hypothetical protein
MKASKKASISAKGKVTNKKKAKNLVSINSIPTDRFKVVDVITDRRGITPSDVRAVLDDKAKRLADYITAILEPEYAVTEGFVARQPNLFPIPSTSISFRNNVNIATDENGDFALSWNPAFFSNLETVSKLHFTITDTEMKSFNTISHIMVRNSGQAGVMRAIPCYVPDVAMSKYRLVSAKLKVTYIGSLLNKAGMMYACATYDQTPVVYGYTTGTNQLMKLIQPNGSEADWSTGNGPMANTYRNMSEQTISNGVWNKSLNITNSNQGMTCLHIPTDPINEIFYPIGSYFGNTYSQSTTYVRPQLVDWAIPSSLISSSGAQLCYLVCGHGLPPGVECINLQVYYTFEVIPTQLSAPFLRAPKDNFSPGERDLVRKVVQTVADKVSVSASQPRNIWSSLKNAIKNVNWGDVANAALSVATHILKTI